MPKYHRPKFLKTTGQTTLNFNEFSEEFRQAYYALGVIEGSHKNLQNPNLLISPLAVKEATMSSKIEGTVSTVSDVFIFQAGGKQDDNDTRQVSNYRIAINEAIEKLEERGTIKQTLIKSLHATLLRGVRHKGPLGNFRREAVYIAEKPNDPIEKALYVPPEHILVQDYMDNICDYLNNSQDDPLIKAAIFHYQFEATHPFSDGNGRLGRLLVPLILCKENALSSPILYLSGYMDANRDEYRGWLHEVDETGKYEGWVSFFLRCIIEQVKETNMLIIKINNLYDEIKEIFDLTKSPYLINFLDFIFTSPTFITSMAKQTLEAKSNLTISRLINLFKEKEIIKEYPFRIGRSKVYYFSNLIDILK